MEFSFPPPKKTPIVSCLLLNRQTCSPATPRLWCCIFPGWFVWQQLSHFLVCRRQLGPRLLLQPLKDIDFYKITELVKEKIDWLPACRHTITTVVQCSWVKGKKYCIRNFYPWRLFSVTSTCTRMVQREKLLYYQVLLYNDITDMTKAELILERLRFKTTRTRFCN